MKTEQEGYAGGRFSSGFLAVVSSLHWNDGSRSYDGSISKCTAPTVFGKEADAVRPKNFAHEDGKYDATAAYLFSSLPIRRPNLSSLFSSSFHVNFSNSTSFGTPKPTQVTLLVSHGVLHTTFIMQLSSIIFTTALATTAHTIPSHHGHNHGVAQTPLSSVAGNLTSLQQVLLGAIRPRKLPRDIPDALADTGGAVST